MASKNHLSLDDLIVAAPCDVAWENIDTDGSSEDKVRSCQSCKLNVYNVKNMNAGEIQSLLQTDAAQNGRLCIQIYRRADGTLLTEDCPRGLARVRQLSTRLWSKAAACLAAIWALASAGSGQAALAQEQGQTPGQDQTQTQSTNQADKAQTAPHRIMGRMMPPRHLQPSGQTQTQKQNQDWHTTAEQNINVHMSAFNLYREGQQQEKSGDFSKAAKTYQLALTAMTGQKHDLKFHLKIETALSRVKAKAGMNQ